MRLVAAALLGAVVAAAADAEPRARRLDLSAAGGTSAGACSAGVTGKCYKGGPLPFSKNTSDAGECCALCYKFKDVTTSNPTACSNWTYNSAPTVAPFFTCELHAEGATTTNATTCTSGMPGPGPCKVDSDCNGGK